MIRTTEEYWEMCQYLLPDGRKVITRDLFDAMIYALIMDLKDEEEVNPNDIKNNMIYPI